MFQLNELLGNRNLLKLLVFFLKNPTKEFSYTEIRKRTGQAKATLTKWLAMLLRNKLISLKKVGVTKLYKLQKEDIVVKYLKILNTIISLQDFKKIGESYRCDIYLFGSAARGEDTEKSDIDLLILGDIRREKIIKEINIISDKIRRDIKINLFDKIEWSTMERKDEAFYERVEKDKIKLN